MAMGRSGNIGKEVLIQMLFAKFYAVISFMVAALVALFYFTGAMTNGMTIALGFTISVLMGVYLLGVYPIMLSEKVAEGRDRARSGGAHRHSAA